MHPFIAVLSPTLFWDVDREAVDPDARPDWTILRIMERGTLDDIAWARVYFGDEEIAESLRKVRGAHPDFPVGIARAAFGVVVPTYSLGRKAEKSPEDNWDWTHRLLREVVSRSLPADETQQQH